MLHGFKTGVVSGKLDASNRGGDSGYPARDSGLNAIGEESNSKGSVSRITRERNREQSEEPG